MGTRQSVAGAGTFVSWIAWYRASASCRPHFTGLLRTPILAPSQILRATEGLTRENDWIRNCPTVGVLVSLSMPTSRPNSTP